MCFVRSVGARPLVRVLYVAFSCAWGGCDRLLKRWRPKQWSVVGNVGPLLLMVMFCGVVYGYGTHGGLRKHGKAAGWCTDRCEDGVV